MCITFLHANPSATGGQPKMVVANNRDEKFSRPTGELKWSDDDILASENAYTCRF